MFSLIYHMITQQGIKVMQNSIHIYYYESLGIMQRTQSTLQGELIKREIPMHEMQSRTLIFTYWNCNPCL